MMKSTVIYENFGLQWVVFGRDPDRPDNLIDTNQYLVVSGDHAIVLDPGGVELFSPMLAALVQHVGLEKIEYLFASHQDPDIISSLGLWDRALPKCKLFAPWMWESFIRHFGCETIEYVAIPDEGMEITLGTSRLQFVPAHYVHSSGNYSVYDPQAKILMSGDIGSALLDRDAPMFVEDFDAHISKMQGFHQRWLPSNRAKNNWIQRIRKLQVDILAPQHGAIFEGENVDRFLDWLEGLDVGIAV